jgi:hypothetical protein
MTESCKLAVKSWAVQARLRKDGAIDELTIKESLVAEHLLDRKELNAGS